MQPRSQAFPGTRLGSMAKSMRETVPNTKKLWKCTYTYSAIVKSQKNVTKQVFTCVIVVLSIQNIP